MLVIGIFFTVMGAAFIVFRTGIGRTGSRERAWLRQWIPMPEDDAYMLMSAMAGWAFLIIGVAVILAFIFQR